MKKQKLCVLLVPVFLCGLGACRRAEPAENFLEDGFELREDSGCEPQILHRFFCAYRAEQRTFPVGEADITFFYGSDSTERENERECKEPVMLTVYNFQDASEKDQLLRTIDLDEFFGEKYACSFDEKSRRLIFSQSETARLSQDLFKDDDGVISFAVSQRVAPTEYSINEVCVYPAAVISFRYTVENSLVTLSRYE